MAHAADKADKWDAQWKKVDEAVQQGLPKTAVERLQPILDGAIAEKDYPVAIKAVGRKIALEGNIQGNKPEEKIIRLAAEIAKAPADMQPMLEVIQADWYWQYFQHNRWRFMQRTATAAGAPGTPGRGKDFTTWDLPRLFAEIDKHFQKALAAEEQLKKIPIQTFGGLLDKGTMPDSYRPTLYDFVAHQALEFYNSGEQAAAKAEDAFELSADSPIFRPAEEFIGWKSPHPLPLSQRERAPPRPSPKRRGRHGFDHPQSPPALPAIAPLPSERRGQGGPAGCRHRAAELRQQQGRGRGEGRLYKVALQRFVKQWGDHPISAIARFRLATVLQGENALVEAHDLAQQGARAFANTPGGDLCYNLVKQIEAKSASIITERVWNEPSPSIRVTYRNLTKVYFRLVHEDWLNRIKSGQYRGEWLDDGHRKVPLAAKPDLAWSADLPPTEDFQQRVEDFPAPKDVKPGFYYLLASHDPGFSASNNVVSYSDVWVSKLALVVRQQNNDGISVVSCSTRLRASRSKGPKCRFTPGIGTAPSPRARRRGPTATANSR